MYMCNANVVFKFNVIYFIYLFITWVHIHMYLHIHDFILRCAYIDIIILYICIFYAVQDCKQWLIWGVNKFPNRQNRKFMFFRFSRGAQNYKCATIAKKRSNNTTIWDFYLNYLMTPFLQCNNHNQTYFIFPIIPKTIWHVHQLSF